MNQARSEVFNNHGVKINWITDLVRHKSEPAQIVAKDLLNSDTKSLNIVALGLGGDELQDNSYKLIDIFKAAQDKSLPINPHLAEFKNSKCIEDILNWTQPKRIGHGIWVGNNNKILRKVIEQKIILEVCLTSNQILHQLNTNSHPIKKLLNYGCEITLNTDDPGLLKTNLIKEYSRALNQYGLSEKELIKTIHVSYDSIYEENEIKNNLKNHLKAHLQLSELTK